MVSRRGVASSNIVLAILLVSVSVSFALVSAAMLPAGASVQDDFEDIVVVTEFLDDERYVKMFSEPPYTIDVIGHWEKKGALTVQVEDSGAKNYEEMEDIVEGLLSGNANITEHEYERWNDLLFSTVDGKELPTLSYDASADPDIVIRLTDEPHQNGRVRAETMLDLDEREIRSTEIVIYSAGNLYRDGEFVAVLQHELGHAIGLGHSNYVGSIMYPSLVIINEEIVGEISGCEAEGVKFAYSTVFEKAECTALVT
jgi:hypothetical protein